MEKSESIKELATALVKAQATLQVAKKGSVNPFYKMKYADLLSVWEACREALTSNGLSVSQIAAVDEEGKTVLETLLMHTSGEWLLGRLPVVAIKSDPQSQGSAITYARRYSLSAIVGLCTDTDDDGEAAMGRKEQTEARMCPIHKVPLVLHKRGKNSWWSHKLESGAWCDGGIKVPAGPAKGTPGYATQEQKDALAKFDKGRIAKIMTDRGFPKKLTELNAAILIEQLEKEAKQ